ncbi:MAG: LicD family protein [Treponema sp.]|nr:LicD family protein [Treponema sp.]
MKETDRIMAKGQFPADFLREEIRCEYKVTQELKKIWMVSLDILFEFDQICKKHNLQYFLLWGSLLGAIRHKGFIPWDDDIDVGMLRQDYEKLLSLKDEFKEPYFLASPKTEKEYYWSHTKLRNSNTTCINKPFRYQPVNFGIDIDIFPIDNLIVDENIDSYDARLRQLNINNSNYMRQSNKNPTPQELERMKGYNSDPDKDMAEIEALATKYNNQKTEYLSCNVCTIDKWQNRTCKACDLQEFILWDFEGFKLPIPKNYDSILKNEFGDYMAFPPVEERGHCHDRNLLNPDVSYKESLKNLL